MLRPDKKKESASTILPTESLAIPISDIIGTPIRLNDIVAVPKLTNRSAVGVVKELLPTGGVKCLVIDPSRIRPVNSERFLFPSEQLAVLNIALDLTNPLHRLIHEAINL